MIAYTGVPSEEGSGTSWSAGMVHCPARRCLTCTNARILLVTLGTPPRLASSGLLATTRSTYAMNLCVSECDYLS